MDLIELFPEATDREVGETKYSLTEYRRYRNIMNELADKPDRTATQEEKYKKAKSVVELLERAVKLIPDDDVRKMVEMRYLNGERFKIVVLYFSGSMHPDTVNEKLKKGVRTVANTVKDIS